VLHATSLLWGSAGELCATLWSHQRANAQLAVTLFDILCSNKSGLRARMLLDGSTQGITTGLNFRRMHYLGTNCDQYRTGKGVSLVMKIWKVNWYSAFWKPFIIGPLHDLRIEHVCSSGKLLTYILKCRVRILTGTPTILKHTVVFLGTVKLIPLLHFNNSKVASSHALSLSLFLIYRSLNVTYFQLLTAP